MAAVAFVAPTSSLHCMVSKGMTGEMLDINESFYIDEKWTNQATRESLESVRQYAALLESSRFSYDHPTASMMSQQLLNDIDIAPSIAHLLPNDVSLDSWQKTYPEQWTCEDVLNLIYFIAMHSDDIELSDFYGEKFQDVNGSELCSMTEDDFDRRDQKYGKMLHGCIKNLLIQSQFLPPEDFPLSVKQEKPDTTPTIQPEIPISVEAMTFDDAGSFEEVRPNYVDIFGVCYDIDPAADFRHIPTTRVLTSTRISNTNNNTQASAKEIRYQGYQHHHPIPTHRQQIHRQSLPHHQQQQHQLQHNHLELPILLDSSRIIADPIQHLHDAGDCNWLTGVIPSHRTPKAERECSFSSDGESSSGGSSAGSPRIGLNTTTSTTATTTTASGSPQDEINFVRTMNGGKGNHLWEFLCQQLRRSETIPTKDKIIQWESRENGVFRIIDSKEISAQWGFFKGNDKMTYEKLSRALRWCRTNGFLATLPKNGKFPKKLCFRFGPKATYWKDFV